MSFSKFRKFNSHEEAEKWLAENYGNYLDTLRKNWKNDCPKSFNWGFPVDWYGGVSYTKVNNWLRGSDRQLVNDELGLKMFVELLNEEIKNGPKIQEDIVVYRGVDHDIITIIMNEISSSGKYKDKGFFSTSLLEDEASKHGEKVMKIYVPRGSYGLGIDPKYEEREMLFPVDSEIKYIEGSNLEFEMI